MAQPTCRISERAGLPLWEPFQLPWEGQARVPRIWTASQVLRHVSGGGCGAHRDRAWYAASASLVSSYTCFCGARPCGVTGMGVPCTQLAPNTGLFLVPVLCPLPSSVCRWFIVSICLVPVPCPPNGGACSWSIITACSWCQGPRSRVVPGAGPQGCAVGAEARAPVSGCVGTEAAQTRLPQDFARRGLVSGADELTDERG